MKPFVPLTILLATAGLSTALHAQDATPPPGPPPLPPPAPSTLTTDKDKLSYAIGTDIAKTFKTQGIEVDPQILATGFRDMAAGGQMQMTPEQITASLRGMQQARMAKMQEARKTAAAASEAEGAKFLAENKSKPDVVTLPDGLEYKVLTQGNGPTPKETDTVSVNYRGTLLNGTEFDSSYKRNEPATFPVNGVIKGWTEILQLMKVGSKYQVFIPSNLAYGERGAGQDIGPGATLTFEIELLSIK